MVVGKGIEGANGKPLFAKKSSNMVNELRFNQELGSSDDSSHEHQPLSQYDPKLPPMLNN